MLARVRAPGGRGPARLGHAGARRACATGSRPSCARLGGTGRARRRSPTSTLGRPLRARERHRRTSAPQAAGASRCARTATRGRGATRTPTPRIRRVPVPGANDAGSGVAVLLEVAERMRAAPPPVGVDLVFLDGEDLGTRERAGRILPRLAATPRACPRRATRRARWRRSCSTWSATATSASDAERNSSERATNLVALVLEAARATGARASSTTRCAGRSSTTTSRSSTPACRRWTSSTSTTRPGTRTATRPTRSSAASLAEVAARRRLARLREPARASLSRAVPPRRGAGQRVVAPPENAAGPPRAGARRSRQLRGAAPSPAAVPWPAADLPRSGGIRVLCGQEWGRCDHSVFCLRGSPKWKSGKKFASWPTPGRGGRVRAGGRRTVVRRAASRDPGVSSTSRGASRLGDCARVQPATLGLSRHESDDSGRLSPRGEFARARPAAADTRARGTFRRPARDAGHCIEPRDGRRNWEGELLGARGRARRACGRTKARNSGSSGPE